MATTDNKFESAYSAEERKDYKKYIKEIVKALKSSGWNDVEVRGYKTQKKYRKAEELLLLAEYKNKFTVYLTIYDNRNIRIWLDDSNYNEVHSFQLNYDKSLPLIIPVVNSFIAYSAQAEEILRTLQSINTNDRKFFIDNIIDSY